MADEQLQRSYYAIIPANVRYDKELTPNAKLLYGEITALCNEKGHCWATNDYFSNLYGVSKTSISKWINSLVQKGYIVSEITYKEGTKQIDNRYLRIVAYPIKEKLIAHNSNDNILTIKNNTIENNTINKCVLGIFDYWNEKKIIPHKIATNEIVKAIEKALNIYDYSQITTCIDRYATVFGDKSYFFNYKWSLKDFLNRKDGISSFTDEGSKWNSYQEFLKNPNPNQKGQQLCESSFDTDEFFEAALARSQKKLMEGRKK